MNEPQITINLFAGISPANPRQLQTEDIIGQLIQGFNVGTQDLYGSDTTLTPTELLKPYNISTVTFNKRLRSLNILIKKQRPSSKDPNVLKDYEALADLSFGENIPQYKGNQIVGYQVQYYPEKFNELLKLANLI